MTCNVYVGARIEDLLLVQDPNDVPLAVAQIFGAVQATSFTERAAAIVDAIEVRACRRPASGREVERSTAGPPAAASLA